MIICCQDGVLSAGNVSNGYGIYHTFESEMKRKMKKVFPGNSSNFEKHYLPYLGPTCPENHTSKKREMLEIYLRQFFGFSAKFRVF